MDKQDLTYLGGLLHDIGKLVFRSQQTKPGENHESLGENFVREFLLTKFDCFKNYEKEILYAMNRGDTFVKFADHASAKERISEDSSKTRRPLYSIFKNVDIGLDDDYIKQNYVYYLEPNPLEMDKNNYPKVVKMHSELWNPDKNEMINLHKSNLEQFKQELIKLYQEGETRHSKAIMTTLYTLLWKYTSTVSSASYLSVPDISLFDHSRMVAALAVSMQNSEDKNTPLILLKGDVSGIQKFIYNEIKETDKASKKLRGRSFFIKLLTDTICNYIIRQFNLYPANIVYNSGGSFEIILPANKDNIETLQSIENKINHSLFKMFGPKLQIVLSWGEYKAESLGQNFSDIQTDLTQKLTNKKLQKSLNILDKIFPKDVLKNETHYHSSIRFDELGTAIPYADYLIEVQSKTLPPIKNSDNEQSTIIELPDFDTYWYIISKSRGVSLEETLRKIQEFKPEMVLIYTLHSTNISDSASLTKKFFDIPIGFSFKFIASHAPIKQEKYAGLMEFEDLAKVDSSNYPLLGIVRMDVDNLGFIFKSGMKSELYSITRLASLSRQMDMFFTRDVSLLAKKHYIYITYSGGDDLFAVGSWTRIIDFALEVRNNFRQYVAENMNITLSGGIAVTKDRYPLAKSALLSEEQEDIAKKSSLPNDKKEGEKDKVALFEIPLKWNEFDNKIKFAKQLVKITQKAENDPKGISSSMIYRLLTYVKQTFRRDGTMNLEMLHRINAKIAYLFGRREITDAKINNIKNDDPNEIKELKKEFLKYFLYNEETQKSRWYATFPVIANYVILKNRKQKSENN